MTKSELITIIRDSLVSGNRKEAEDAVDLYFEKRRVLELLEECKKLNEKLNLYKQ